MCVFCGGQGGSAEHVFADWITDVLPGDGVFTTGGTGKRTKQSSRLASVTRSVCEGCNNEWMSVLESMVRPLIQPAIEGDATVWSGAEQGTIAAWSLKTALAADSAYEERYAPTKHARHIYETREVPDSVRLWVGAVAYDLAKGHYDSVGAYRNAFTAESESGNTTFAGYSVYLR